MHAYAWWWLAACSSPEHVDTDAPIDTDAVADTDDDGGVDSDVDFDELNGERPDELLALPAFTATNRDGSERGPDDLRGHPTVIWFYPAAGTAG